MYTICPLEFSNKMLPVPIPWIVGIGPVGPVGPVDPVDPVNPVDPVGPVNPVNPVNPVDPVNPEKPLERYATFTTSYGFAPEGVGEVGIVVKFLGPFKFNVTDMYSIY